MKLKQILTMTFDDRKKVLELLPHKVQVKFAIYCAELVTHLDTSVEGPKALAVAKAWLEGKATKEECEKAANAAYTFASTYFAASSATAYVSATASANAANAAHAAFAYASAFATASAYAGSPSTNKVKMVKYLQLLCLQEFHKENKLINLLFKV